MQGSHAIPRRLTPAVLTVDTGAGRRRAPRFLNLVVRACREWEQGRVEEPVWYRVAS